MLVHTKLFPSFLMTLLTILSMASTSEARPCEGQLLTNRACSDLTAQECGDYYMKRGNKYHQCYEPGGVVSDLDCRVDAVRECEPSGGGKITSAGVSTPSLPSMGMYRPESIISTPEKEPQAWGKLVNNLVNNMERMLRNTAFCAKGGLFTKTIRSSSGNLCAEEPGASLALRFCTGISDFDQSQCAGNAKLALRKEYPEIRPIDKPEFYKSWADTNLKELVLKPAIVNRTTICVIIAKILPKQFSMCRQQMNTLSKAMMSRP